MSKFGDLIGGNTTEVKTEVQPTVEPVVDTTPASVEDPVNPEPLNLWNLSKDELEDAMEVFTTSIQIAHFDIKV